MIFKGLRKFAGNEMIQVFRYLSGTLADYARDLGTGLSRLTFRENFACFVSDVSAAAASQKSFSNQLNTADVDILFLNATQPFYLATASKDQITVGNYGAAAGKASVLVMRR